ncbi:MAG: hypothetical protein ACOZAN_04500 [Patescibacteria group bacterium]
MNKEATLKNPDIIRDLENPYQLIRDKLGVDLNGLVTIKQLIDETVLKLVESQIHKNLFSSDDLTSKLTSPHPGIEIRLQAIGYPDCTSEGTVAEHDHGNDNVTEIIITIGDSVYPGLPEPLARTTNHTIYLVRAGTTHGSNSQPASGKWLSIKIKDYIQLS